MIDLREDIRYLPSQEIVGCCTASASLLVAEMLINRSGANPMHFSRLFVYYMTRKMQGRIGQKGAELGATLEAMKQYGCCTDRLWPLRPTIVDKEPNAVAMEEAKNYKIGTYTNVIEQDFNYLLNKGYPIIIGLATGRQFWKLNGKLSEQVYKPINDIDNRPSHGHAVTIIGYTDDYWMVANSSGLKWGDKGYGILPYACRQDIGEAYIINDFAGIPSEKNF